MASQLLTHRTSLLFAFLLLLGESEQHARLLEPPSRASMWRLGFPTPKDQDDNQSYCGGFGVQHGRNGGKCGICGDPWDEAPFRRHEAPGGIYATGIVTKTYRQGSLIPIIIDVTANHQGHFEFKLCPNNNIFVDPVQQCFDANPLTTGVGMKTKFPINDRDLGLRLLYVRLPLDVTCEQCILQWSYVGGNNWGDCDDGTSGLGCGPQETFRSCADITITPHPLLNSAIYPSELAPNDGEENGGENDITIDFAELRADSDDEISLRQKEELLAKKKLMLEKVLDRLQELILLSQQEPDSAALSTNGVDNKYSALGGGVDGSSGGGDMNALDDMRAEATEQRIFSPENRSHDIEFDIEDRESIWWQRIFSNKH